MNSFSNHVHVDEFAVAATPAELAELNEWIHEEMIAMEADEADEVDPSGGCDEDDSEGCADFEDGLDWDTSYADEQFEYDEYGP